MAQTAWKALQSHRHDLQNYLQLMKAYLQLQRPERALAVVDDCAQWLASLSLLQSQLSEDASPVLFAATACPHLRVSVEGFYSTLADDELCECLFWLEQQAIEHNTKYIVATVSLTEAQDALPEAAVSATPEWEVIVDSPEPLSWLNESYIVNETVFCVRIRKRTE